MSKVKVRFAPSPTGSLHIGGLRSALYNYLFAKQNGGEFLLRVEDTDKNRYVEGSVEKMQESLKWAGIEWDENIYTQSEHLDVYKKHAEQLIKDDKAYYCFCEPERLQKMREDQTATKQAPMYDQYCLKSLDKEEINKNLKNNCPYTIRLRIPENETIEFDDIVRGKVKFETNTIDDQILLKSDGYPTYHLANVVDDHLMNVTHVIRGEEWLPSTPKHILLYKAFGWDRPEFAHLPLLLDTNRKKLSKREMDVSVEDYINKGYIKDALINFVAFLGWNPGKGSTKEIFSLEELIKEFKLENVHKGGAVFDVQKLDWLNGQYIKNLPIDELYKLALPFLEQKEFYEKPSPQNPLPKGEGDKKEYIKKVLTVEQDRLNNLSAIGESNKFFFQDIKCDKKLLKWKDMKDDELKESLEKSKKVLNDNKNWTKESLEKELLEAAGDKRGELLWPLRVALTGEKKSPPPGEVAWVLGKDESIKRINSALEKL
ncbi:glutamate--tRNA ligase [bacterium BMS3Abin15]|nr:glutamate--tRNA ligase [bacterium BMS3Abin15]HDZ85058.1 glutamate--tRNA ligase [Candidatus Moranbacteria bacterium]